MDFLLNKRKALKSYFRDYTHNLFSEIKGSHHKKELANANASEDVNGTLTLLDEGDTSYQRRRISY